MIIQSIDNIIQRLVQRVEKPQDLGYKSGVTLPLKHLLTAF